MSGEAEDPAEEEGRRGRGGDGQRQSRGNNEDDLNGWRKKLGKIDPSQKSYMITSMIIEMILILLMLLIVSSTRWQL